MAQPQWPGWQAKWSLYATRVHLVITRRRRAFCFRQQNPMWATISVRKKEMIQNLKNVFIHPLEEGGGRKGKEELEDADANRLCRRSITCRQALQTREGSSPRPPTNETHYLHYIWSFLTSFLAGRSVSFYRWGNWSLEPLSDLPKVTQQAFVFKPERFQIPTSFLSAPTW